MASERPLDQYNDDLFPVLSQMGFLYHSSSAQGHSSQSIDGSTDLYWPGTLESGHPIRNCAIWNRSRCPSTSRIVGVGSELG